MIRPTLFYSSNLNKATDENSHFTSITFSHAIITTSDKENTSVSLQQPTITEDKRENRAFITKVYESEEEEEEDEYDNDDTEADTYLTSLKSIEDLPYHFPVTDMSYETSNLRRTDSQRPIEHNEQTIQTGHVAYNDRTVDTNDLHSNANCYQPNSATRKSRALAPICDSYEERRRQPNNRAMADISNEEQSHGNEKFRERTLTPTKYRLLKERYGSSSHLNNDHREGSQYSISKEKTYSSQIDQVGSWRKEDNDAYHHKSQNRIDQNGHDLSPEHRDDYKNESSTKRARNDEDNNNRKSQQGPTSEQRKTHEERKDYDGRHTDQSNNRNRHSSEINESPTRSQNQSSNFIGTPSKSSKRLQQSPKQYHMKSGVLEIRKSPSRNSLNPDDLNDTDVEFIFKPKFQATDANELAQYIIKTTADDQPISIDKSRDNPYRPGNNNNTPSGESAGHMNIDQPTKIRPSSRSPSKTSDDREHPPRPDQYKSTPRNKLKYSFDYCNQNGGSYDDSDYECVAFGHGLHKKSSTNINTKPYTNNLSSTAAEKKGNFDGYSNSGFLEERDAGTSTTPSLLTNARRNQDSRAQQGKSGLSHQSPGDENPYTAVSDLHTSGNFDRNVSQNPNGNRRFNKHGPSLHNNDDTDNDDDDDIDDQDKNDNKKYNNQNHRGHQSQPPHFYDEEV